MPQKIIDLNDRKIGNDLPVTLIAGPCQLETEEHAIMIASTLAEICDEEKINFVFKGSFDKANRTSVNGTRGVGLSRGLQILGAVKEKIGCAVLTDIHNTEQCGEVSDIVDILQIPAFLCRQTDIILAASKTNKVVNIKKGQFLAPWDMEKVLEAGYTGINTRAGDLMNIRFDHKSADADRWAQSLHIVLTSDQILEVRDSGVQVFD